VLAVDERAADDADELTTDARNADAALAVDERAADAALTSAAGFWRQNTSSTEKLPVSACPASK
jgi:hypothetical protein